MRVIVTRVQPQAACWAKSLGCRFETVAWPLIEVTAVANTSAVEAAGQRWSAYAAVMFVSSHAVAFFFASNPVLTKSLKASDAINTRAWVTGPASRAALLSHGYQAHLIDAPLMDAGQFDSEALWHQVQAQISPGVRVLIVRGNTVNLTDVMPATTTVQGIGRDWLAQQLHQAGAQLDFVVAYQRSAPIWNGLQLAQAVAAATDGSVWLFSSAEALQHLKALLPEQSWLRARAVATHERIAQAARDLGFSVVKVSRPALPEVLASIESLS